VAALHLPMNFLVPLFTGLVIQIHGSEQHGRRAKDWRSSLGIGEPCFVLGKRLTIGTVDGVAGFRRLVADSPSGGREFSDSIDGKVG
jgi:hypothetical protein